MATIKAFKALRPAPDKAADVAALPYDVYNRQEAKKEVQGKEDSFLRVDRPEITLDDEIAIDEPVVYQTAKKNLDRLIEREALIEDSKEQFYIYELIMAGRSQAGLVVCTAIDEYLDNTIKKHELTRADKELDRINHVDACNANTGPIFLTYRAQKEIDEIILSWQKKKDPVYDFISDDGITHRAWAIDDQATIDKLVRAFKGVDSLYIADGHHRSASAVKVGLMRREAHPDNTGQEEFNFFLSVLFPDDQLYVMDYNRVVKDLNGLSSDAFLKKLATKFEIEAEKEAVKPKSKGEFGLYLDKKWYRLRVKEGVYNSDDPVEALDVSILQEHVLIPILGIKDVRTDNRIDFVGGIRGLGELERRANSDMKLAFSVFPTAIDELIKIADHDLLMPPKSTWFEPKLRSGLFIHKLD